MKILFNTEQYYPLQTGVSIADYGLSVALAQAGHVVFVATGSRFDGQKICREGPIQMISSAGISKEAREISPNLFVIEFDIYWDWTRGCVVGETQAYRDFCVPFACDLLISSGIVGKWNCDLLYDLLPSCRAKKKILKSHGEQELVYSSTSIPLYLKNILKFLLSGFKFRHPSYIPWLRSKLKQTLKHYDCVYFLHQRSPGYAYLKPYCHVGILPNGIFAKDINPPKTFCNDLVDRGVAARRHSSIPLEHLVCRPYCLNISNYYKEKGQSFVLEAYYLSQACIPLVFVGALNANCTLENLNDFKAQLDDKYGPKEVYFFYQVERNQVLDLFKHATLFLHGSHYEAFPM
ncbi:glycosyltransferase, partial [Helicobacter salomonis]|uniref:glycosyltransferase n=1 Tax=Helicobacter salomonis TaxID=56878 RepID=UPI000CF0398D